jgi:hypothetical protein
MTRRTGAPADTVSLRTSLTERPTLLAGVTAAGCSGAYFLYERAFGCFQLNPAPSDQIMRNSGRGPSQTNLSELNLERSWKLKAGKVAQSKAKVSSDDDDAVAASGTPTIGLGIEAQNPLNHKVLPRPKEIFPHPISVNFAARSQGEVYGEERSL